MRVVIRRKGKGVAAVFRPLAWAALAVLLIALLGGASVFTFYYVRFSRMIDERLQGPVFPQVSQIYAAPVKLHVGQTITAAEVVSQLQLAGLAEKGDSPKGRYQIIPDGVRIYPGPDSYFSSEPAELDFADGKLGSIVSLKDQFARSEFSLEPLLITNLFDSHREKRRLVPFADLPPDLVHAILAAEDRRFFEHSGLDLIGILRAASIDLRTGRIRQGASTITQQLARSLFLSPNRTWRRKLAEAMVAIQLEHHLTKDEIFEHYCNTVYLGYRGSFSILGVGEAAENYFHKDVRNLTLPEAALLAGIIRGPALYSPFHHPDAAIRRRNQVLDAMVETGAITPQQRDQAVKAPLDVVTTAEGSGEAPYFVDMVKEQLLNRFSEDQLTSQSYHVYTTLDLRLQHAAVEAVAIGTQELDQRLAQMRKGRKKSANTNAPVPEVALVALDPHTGAIKALVGGRNYGQSQLNRALAERQPGSVFKPFVYAAALTAYRDGSSEQPWTTVSKVDDEPTTFMYNGKPYEPANYGQDYYGEVTLRYALAHSLNVATVKIAQSVGYDNIVSLARRAGLNDRIEPTPAVALGAYEVTPLEIAGAYTIFANHGVREDPYFLSMVRSPSGRLLDIAEPHETTVLDPATAYLMTNLMQGVINSGTGEGVRARGFTAPAAGKTGTSHDGWFAGYTSGLLCVVWVGYDSDQELPLSGASSALPIWTEFMKRAITVPEFSDTSEFEPPAHGIVKVQIDPESGELATPYCPTTVTEYFLEGTEPTLFCHLHYLPSVPRAVPVPNIARVGENVPAPPPTASAALPGPPPAAAVQNTPPPPAEQKKPGLLRRIFGIFGGGGQNKQK